MKLKMEEEVLFRCYIENVLNSPMILDEDLEVLNSCFDLTLFQAVEWDTRSLLMPSIGGLLGTFLCACYRSVYPLVLGVPLGARLCRLLSLKRRKNEFKTLMDCLREIHRLNKDILYYLCKRNRVQSETSRQLLSKSINFLVKTIEKLQMSAGEIVETVTVSGNETYTRIDLSNFEMADELRRLEVLNDIYILTSSSFLRSLGLFCCVNMWTNPKCDFNSVFQKIIPKLCHFLWQNLNEIRNHFRLSQKTLTVANRKVTNTSSKLQKTMDDLLINIQSSFELSVQIQDQLDNFDRVESNVRLLSERLVACRQSFKIFSNTFTIISKRHILDVMPKIETPVKEVDLSSLVRVSYDDPPNEPLEDEEYSLLIHSDDLEEEPVTFNCSQEDGLTLEDLKSMLTELKSKIAYRKSKKNADNGFDEKENVRLVTVDKNDILENSTVDKNESIMNNGGKSQAIPPPPPPLPLLLSEEDRMPPSLLEGVKMIAQKLKRAEDVFGSDGEDEDEEYDGDVSY